MSRPLDGPPGPGLAAPPPPTWLLDRLIAGLALVLIGLALIWVATRGLPAQQGGPAGRPRPPIAAPRRPAEGYLVCSWNVENFYDDRDDPRFRDSEEDWYGRNPAVVAEKVRRLADALMLQGDGRGPDVLAMVEVESRRCVELLRDEVNARLPDELAYTTIVQRDNATGRHNGPAILARIPADDRRTRTFGIRRILEAHLVADGAPLVILASHWTSRLRGDTESKRAAYADALYARVLEIVADDPAADVLLCGDYNDEPDDPSLTDHLHAVSLDHADRVRETTSDPTLLDLMAGRDPEAFGTYRERGRWQVLDHLVAAPGLLDPAGWLVVPDSTRVARDDRLRAGRDGHPRRFGSPTNAGPRGPSDHFAVTVRLRVGHDPSPGEAAD